MSYLLESVPNQMLQQRELKYEKKVGKNIDQQMEHDIVLLCDKTYAYNSAQAETGMESCQSLELAMKKEGKKKVGETKRRRENSGVSVQAQGSHVGRVIGRKERHNKVSTSRGQRDRRVRLSAYTAIQFYDVQDRLGYDRPSKALDWLIEKAKAAIASLEDLPSQNYELAGPHNSVMQTEQGVSQKKTSQLQHCQGCNLEAQKTLNQITMNNEVIFSVAAGSTTSCSSQFLDCVTEKNLQPSKSPDFDLHQSSPIDLGEELNPPTNLSDLSTIVMDLNSCSFNGEEEFIFSSLPAILQQPLLCENQFSAQWGPLQSSNLFSVHVSANPPISVNGHSHIQSPNSHLFSTSELSSGGFVGI